MICEIGEHFTKGDVCKQMLKKMMTADIEGIFYWEPQASAGHNSGYPLGCFNKGVPTEALEAFKEVADKNKNN